MVQKPSVLWTHNTNWECWLGSNDVLVRTTGGGVSHFHPPDPELQPPSYALLRGYPSYPQELLSQGTGVAAGKGGNLPPKMQLEREEIYHLRVELSSQGLPVLGFISILWMLSFHTRARMWQQARSWQHLLCIRLCLFCLFFRRNCGWQRQGCALGGICLLLDSFLKRDGGQKTG